MGSSQSGLHPELLVLGSPRSWGVWVFCSMSGVGYGRPGPLSVCLGQVMRGGFEREAAARPERLRGRAGVLGTLRPYC